jgi:HEAT repeats
VRRRVYIFLAAVVLGVAALLTLHRSEPSYEGKSLSGWIIEMRDGREQEKARAVVHQLGTNSIPLLLEWLERPDRPSLRERFWQAKHGVIGYLEGHRWMKPREWTWEMDWRGSYRSLAQGAFEEMGPDGREAIPTLIQWLGRKARTTNELDVVAGAAYLVLGHMAPASILPLIDAISTPDDQVYALAAGALANIGPEAKAAIPVLRQRLNHKNPLIRVGAADVIGKIGGDPEEFMPVIVQTLREPDLENLDYVLDILLRYKDHAKGAVPILLELLHSIPESGNLTQRMARDQLKGALGQLAPDAIGAGRVQ